MLQIAPDPNDLCFDSPPGPLSICGGAVRAEYIQQYITHWQMNREKPAGLQVFLSLFAIYNLRAHFESKFYDAI